MKWSGEYTVNANDVDFNNIVSVSNMLRYMQDAANYEMEEDGLSYMIEKLQWIVMEYTTIRQILFLQWLRKKETVLSYETVRDAIVVVTRMMGYDDEDIYEYLSNSFSSVIWEFGYAALLLGTVE